MIAFAYYGGKNRLQKQLIRMFPPCYHYCEPFAGSAAVLLNREPVPIETLNDINGDIVNFFEVLRDNADLLITKLLLTPYSRQEFINCWEHSTDPVERARRTFVKIQMDIAKAGAKKDRGWSSNVTYLKGNHSYAVKNFFSKVVGLSEVADRLRMVQIENRPAVELIEKYDSPTTFFYCDPPYLPATRTSSNDYRFEMSENAHHELANALLAIKGNAAVSGYDDPIMEDLYPGWFKHEFKAKQVPMSRGKGLLRQECLWMNYDISQLAEKGPLFSSIQSHSNHTTS